MPANSPEEIIRAAFGLLQILKDNLPDGVKLSIQREDEVVTSALKRHALHLSTLVVNQEHLDPFKLLCWIGCEIIIRLEDESYHQHETVLDALIYSLEIILAMETKCQVILTPDDRKLIGRYVMEELKGNPDHGIGFNGLFVAFHCFRSAYIQISGRAKN